MTKSQYDLSDASHGALSHTLAQLWDKTVSYGTYNDQPPEAGGNNDDDASSSKKKLRGALEEWQVGAPTGGYGHTKGAIAVGFSADAANASSSAGGFWLIHSVPRFPLMNESSYTGLPWNEQIYAQSFICVSLSATSLNKVGTSMQLNSPDMFSSRVLAAATQTTPALAAVIQGTVRADAICETTSLTTVGGANVDMFAKSYKWGKDLWNGCVSETYKQSTVVESWIRGYEEGPYCTPHYAYETLDVEYVTFGGVSFKETQDHSKWGITTGNAQNVCIGDINRMTSQMTRGGGTLCLTNQPDLWNAFHSAIDQTDSC